ncbi:MAG: type II secretion system protein [Candidatus Aureabacteria bacterium]|nr:type II secretion system protein [Candidatus Auribacterota bacterium]
MSDVVNRIMMMRISRHSAFTLIEILVVMAVIALLMALLLPKLTGTSHKSEVIACAANLKKLGAAFFMYVLENDGYAPYNPDCGDHQGSTNLAGDYFYSWEALYLLGPYLDDPDHSKFKKGEWMTVRCPGNRCHYYTTGGDKGVDHNGAAYSPVWQNRQAPATWPSTTIVFDPATHLKMTGDCSPGRQIVDYQYNVSLGGIFNPLNEWGTRYKVDYVLQFPDEAVIFCDIQYANVLHRTQNIPGKDKFVYAYPTTSVCQFWGGDQSSDNGAFPEEVDKNSNDPAMLKKYMRTNERIHDGRGINAVFMDGHVEFLEGTAAYNGYGFRSYADDLLCWGISGPLYKPDETNYRLQIKGIEGFRRNKDLSTNKSLCIEHNYKKKLSPDTTACWRIGAN